MDTIIANITQDKEANEAAINKAAEIIAKGGLVAFPTETVYGLGADAFDATAARRIYEAKGRPSDNPLIVHIAHASDMTRLSDRVPLSAYKLADYFWPGPLTMIIPKSSAVSDTVTGGLNTVAVRLPSNPVARALIEKSGTFIAAPSANLSGRPSPTKASHVIEDMAGRIDMILADGDIEIGLESTIVDLTGEVPMILRPGFITREQIAKVLGSAQLDPALMTGVKGDVKPKAPGMKYRHYAPKAELTVVEGEQTAVVKMLQACIDKELNENKKVGVMITTKSQEWIAPAEGLVRIVLGDSTHEEEIAHNLFAALRSFDDEEVDVIYSEGFSMEGVGQAIMNRLLKAAGQKIIYV